MVENNVGPDLKAESKAASDTWRMAGSIDSSNRW
jgi:hypothetical protein